MENLNLDNYISYLRALNKINKEINNSFFYEELVEKINELIDFIMALTCFNELESMIKLTDYLVHLIDKVNNGDKKELFTSKKELNSNLDCLISEIKSLFNINIYFKGNDKYGMMSKRYIDSYFSDLNVIKNNKISIDDNKNNKKNNFNILIVENELVLKNLKIDGNFDVILDYSKLANEMFVLTSKIYNHYYDYHYLRNELEYAKSNSVKNIIVGNSYPLTGLDKSKLKDKTVNLSLSSQDLYYSYQLAKEAISKNKDIKKCIIGVGYYLTYHDLSKGANDYSKNMIASVYKPLLNDVHNSIDDNFKDITRLEDLISDDLLFCIFNLNEVEKYMSNLCYKLNPSYFNDKNKREKVSVMRGIDFNSLNEEEKFLIGSKRAAQHNKLIKYQETNTEFKNILKDFLKYLNNSKVEAIFVVFPTTKYYNYSINKEYEQMFYNNLNAIKNEFKFKVIDFNEIDGFNDYDFIDVDHLSEVGCNKITNLLNELI